MSKIMVLMVLSLYANVSAENSNKMFPLHIEMRIFRPLNCRNVRNAVILILSNYKLKFCSQREGNEIVSKIWKLLFTNLPPNEIFNNSGFNQSLLLPDFTKEMEPDPD